MLRCIFMCKNQQFFDLQGDCKLLYFRVLQINLKIEDIQ